MNHNLQFFLFSAILIATTSAIRCENKQSAFVSNQQQISHVGDNGRCDSEKWCMRQTTNQKDQIIVATGCDGSSVLAQTCTMITSPQTMPVSAGTITRVNEEYMCLTQMEDEKIVSEICCCTSSMCNKTPWSLGSYQGPPPTKEKLWAMYDESIYNGAHMITGFSVVILTAFAIL